jgi:hypothetical protein
MAEGRNSTLEELPMWVVYDHPIDFPNSYVARLHQWDEQAKAYVASPTEMMVAADVDLIRRELFSLGFHKLDRHPDDLPVIMETWV